MLLSSLGGTTKTADLCLRQTKDPTATEGGEEKKKNGGVKTEEAEQEQSYAVISMRTAVCSGPVQLAPSGSAPVVLQLRTPSVEPTLEAE